MRYTCKSDCITLPGTTVLDLSLYHDGAKPRKTTWRKCWRKTSKFRENSPFDISLWVLCRIILHWISQWNGKYHTHEISSAAVPEVILTTSDASSHDEMFVKWRHFRFNDQGLPPNKEVLIWRNGGPVQRNIYGSLIAKRDIQRRIRS